MSGNSIFLLFTSVRSQSIDTRLLESCVQNSSLGTHFPGEGGGEFEQQSAIITTEGPR